MTSVVRIALISGVKTSQASTTSYRQAMPRHIYFFPEQAGLMLREPVVIISVVHTCHAWKVGADLSGSDPMTAPEARPS